MNMPKGGGFYACAPASTYFPGIMIALGLMQPYLFLCFYLSRRESVGGSIERRRGGCSW